MLTILFDIFIYLVIGFILSVISWIWFIDTEAKKEGAILIYFMVCTFTWPALILTYVVNKIYDFLHKLYII